MKETTDTITHYVECECQNEIITVRRVFDESDDLFVDTYYQYNPNLSFISRVKHAFNILVGRKTLSSSVVLNRDSALKLSDDIKKMYTERTKPKALLLD